MAILEVCAGSLESAMAAAQGGAQRIELCEALELDGLTPSDNIIAAARAIPGLKLHVLIRPRPGNFVYDQNEVVLMIDQIHRAVELGADGVVFGALTPEGKVDMDVCRKLAAASTVPITFHRAFDQAADPFEALEDVISLGCTRLLTSGQAATAHEATGLIYDLVCQSAGRIIIMPGSGVRPENAAAILARTGCKEIHSSARANSKEKDSDPETVATLVKITEQF